MPTREITRERLGKLLIDKGLISPSQLDEALKQHELTGRPLGEVLVALNFVKERDVLEVLSQQMEVPYFDLTNFTPTPEALNLVPKETALELYALPVFKVGNVVTIAMADPLDLPALVKLRKTSRADVNPVLSSSRAILKAIETYYALAGQAPAAKPQAQAPAPPGTQGFLNEKVPAQNVAGAGVLKSVAQVPPPLKQPMPGGSPEAPAAPRSDLEAKDGGAGGLMQAAKEAPIIRKVNGIIEQAVKDGASDIHFQPTENQLFIRYRIDGVLHRMTPVPRDQQDAMISRVKIMSEIDIAERRLPQDGRIQLQVNGQDVDVRVSTFPTIYGESVVMRILVKTEKPPELKELGFSKKMLADFEKLIKRPNGIVLVTGPTGSGKTTTLYAGLGIINTVDKNIITLEDPVEYRLEGIRQSQISAKAGLTFARGLRSILRQDPDIIMVGEIRDLETAEIAIHAALTGHLVLSTLHTNDASSTVARLVDMGVEPFLVASSIIGVLAQRLVRLICPDCKEEVKVSDSLLASLKLESSKRTKFFRGKGCKACMNTGYRGRSVIAELMIPSSDMRQLVVEKASSDRIREAMIREGMPMLMDDGLEKAQEGLTTLEEVLRLA